MSLPHVPEFDVWEEDDGWHARWQAPLTPDEQAARIPEQAHAPHLERLQSDCAWLRIRRDVINRTRRFTWRKDLTDLTLRTGDPL